MPLYSLMYFISWILLAVDIVFYLQVKTSVNRKPRATSSPLATEEDEQTTNRTTVTGENEGERSRQAPGLGGGGKVKFWVTF